MARFGRGQRLLLLGCVVVMLLASPLAAEAKHAANGDWSQIYNGAWPDPGNNIACNPCVQWKNDFSGTWEYALAGRWPGVYESISQWAVASWSGITDYKSPYFGKGPNSNRCATNNEHVCVTATTDMPESYCGQAIETWNLQNQITHGTAYYHSGKSYTNGPNNSTSNYAACDARSNMLHEVGHTYSEGHSARGWAIMFNKDNEKEKIDGLAKQELNAVYGPSNSPAGPGPSLDLQTLKAKAFATAQALYAQLLARAEAVGGEPSTAP